MSSRDPAAGPDKPGSPVHGAGIVVGSQAGACLAMESAKDQGLLSAEQIDQFGGLCFEQAVRQSVGFIQHDV